MLRTACLAPYLQEIPQVERAGLLAAGLRRWPEVRLGEIAFDSTLYRATQFWAYHGLLFHNQIREGLPPTRPDSSEYYLGLLIP